MAYSKKIDELKKKLSDAAKDLDQKYKIKETIDQGVETATEELRRGTDVAATGVDAAQREFKKLDREYDISGTVKRTTEELADVVKKGVDAAEGKAERLIGEAGKYYAHLSRATHAAERSARFSQRLKSNIEEIRVWVKQNPGKAALVGLSVIAGARAGSAFPGLETVLLGAGHRGHWLFHSAVTSYGLRKVSERFFDYMNRQEQLVRAGQLDRAEARRVAFQRDIAKYVGAPLLGTFSVAVGATLIAESVSPGRIVGTPIELILGGNPILNSMWLFSNGLVCIHNGYKFFLMALAEEQDMSRVVSEGKLLLPA